MQINRSDRRRSWIAVSMLLLPGAGCRIAPPERDVDTLETERIARDFMHLQYEEKNLIGAKAKYYSPDFTQHNPEIANGRTGDQNFIAAREQRDPEHFLPIEQWVNKIDHVLIDGKLFAIHHRLYTSPQDRGRVFLDIWRTENGKMVEHWDVIQAIPENALNDNDMWGDLLPRKPAAARDPLPQSVIRDYLRMGLEQGDPRAAAEKYLADDFRQHSPHIADGKAAALAYFAARAALPAAASRVSSVSHILSDKDLVLVTRHVTTGPQDRGFMYADLFRVRQGKIVEHWDVIQAVPAESVNGNHMW
jgi:predicted SnoaL-like aldol condensation-catalyzing enzyme